MFGLALPAFLSRIPRFAWIALAIGLALLALTAWHRSEVRHADRAGYARAMTEVQAKAERIRREAEASARKAEQLQRDITIQERTANDEQARVVSSRASDLRRMRPQAACRAGAGTATAVSRLPGEQAPDRPRDAAVAVPAGDWIVLPYQQTVDFAESHDLLRAEVLTCRSAWDRQGKVYEAWREETIRAGQRR